ncbi:hypothetical protein CBS101457_001266 [Exobasidium rhododendri]|nr:hypothetical protein CBS101457_001266 [Exobasidium rhododendri]
MPVAGGAASLFTPRKVATYGLLSTFAALGVILGAFRQRSNFYSAAVMLGRSNGCMMVLFNFGLFLTLCLGKLCQKVFFGPLRATEVEHLYEKSWYAITETLLAMTIFRDEFGANFVLLFGTLLFLKVFHWLSADRVEFMEQSPSVSRLFHIRMCSVLWTLFGLDLFLVAFAVEVLLMDKNKMGIMIMFASEFVILTATLFSIVAKYIINVQDMRSEEPWEGKSMYVFFVDLATDFLKLMTYLTFFGLILSFYGLPLNIIRDVYVTARSFFGRLRDFIKYRAATKNMDTRFPDATRQDLSAISDGTCIICREEMVARATEEAPSAGNESRDQSTTQASFSPPPPPPLREETSGSSGLNETPKKLPCGHIFHFHCLRSWLERQQSCPTCRRTVFSSPTTQPDTSTNGQQAADITRPGPTNTGSTANSNSNSNSTNAGPGPATAANASQTARDRLQGFLQQLQTDAQRVREQNRQHTPRATSPPAHSNIASMRNPAHPLPPHGHHSAADAGSSARSSRNAVKPLISSLFGQTDASGSSINSRRDVGTNDSPSTTTARTDQRDELIASLVPPAPWTLRPNRAITSSDRASNPRQTSSNDPASPPAQGDATAQAQVLNAHETNMPLPTSETVPAKVKTNEEVSSLDPADAREAARAAALRRFAAHSHQPTPVVSKPSPLRPSDDHTLGKNDEGTESQKTIELPGNPQLLPLFDTSKIVNFASDFAPHLPFPLVEGVGNGPSLPRSNTFVSSNDAIEEEIGTLLALNSQELQLLSQKSRRGLEERLRLMTRVEGAIGGLVEELTRALSVFPVNDEVRLDDGVAPNSEESRPTPSQKGKQAAEGINSDTVQ